MPTENKKNTAWKYTATMAAGICLLGILLLTNKAKAETLYNCSEGTIASGVSGASQRSLSLTGTAKSVAMQFKAIGDDCTPQTAASDGYEIWNESGQIGGNFEYQEGDTIPENSTAWIYGIVDTAVNIAGGTRITRSALPTCAEGGASLESVYSSTDSCPGVRWTTTVQNGTDWFYRILSDEPSAEDFLLGANPFGGGGGGSWGDGDATGGAVDWQNFFDNVPSHDDVYGACDFFSLAATQGDGLDCLWSWIQYAVWPPAEGFIDLVSQPLNTLQTRWPLVYLTSFYGAAVDGINGLSSCPLPVLTGNSYGGTTLPTITPCNYTATITTTFTNSSAFQIGGVLFVWLGLITAALAAMREFFKK